MKKQVAVISALIKQIFLKDKVSALLFFLTLVIAVFIIIIWKLKLINFDTSYTWRVRFSPMQFLGLIFLINTALGFFSYNKEKEIAYLLFGGTLFITILIFILQVFYLTSL